MTIPKIRFAVLIATVCLFAISGDIAAQASHAHMGHVADSWGDAPDEAGLLPTASAEAEIAALHAGLAARASGLGSMKAHIGHVLNAIDPSVEPSGPGKGYGVGSSPASSGASPQLSATCPIWACEACAAMSPLMANRQTVAISTAKRILGIVMISLLRSG